MIENYNNLHKRSVIDGSWFVHYDVSESKCITKTTWKECANKYAPTGGDNEWLNRNLGDRMSLFALARCTRGHSNYTKNACPGTSCSTR